MLGVCGRPRTAQEIEEIDKQELPAEAHKTERQTAQQMRNTWTEPTAKRMSSLADGNAGYCAALKYLDLPP